MNAERLSASSRAAWGSRWMRAAQALVTILLLSWLAGSIDAGVWQALSGIKALTLLACFLVFASAQLIGGFRLWLLTPGATLRGAQAATWVGYFWGNFLPSSVGGDIIRLMRLRGEGIPGATAAGALVLDRIANLLPILAVVAFAALTSSLSLAVNIDPVWGFAFALMGLAGAVALWLVRRRLAGPIRRVLQPARQLVRRPGLILGVALLSAANIGVSILAQLWLARALGIVIDIVELAQIIAVLTLVVMLPVSLNGLGVQEAGYVVALTTAGAPLDAAIAFSLLARLLILATSLLVGLFVLAEKLRPRQASGAG